MAVPIRILIVEDCEDDALLILRQLRKKGYECLWTRVETAEEMKKELANTVWDLIIADYNLPEFGAPEALALLKSERFDIPFIIVSGEIDEKTAVSSMEAGAHDYLTKDNLVRLVPAIERELREARQRRERKRSEEALKMSEERFRTVVDASIDALISVDLDGSISLFNLAASKMLGFDWTDVIGKSIALLFDPFERSEVELFIVSHNSSNGGKKNIVSSTIEVNALKKDGNILPVELSVSKGVRDRQDFFLVILRDISEKKLQQKALEETEAQLRLSQKMEAIGRLAGGVAHDFNNLLGAIIGYSDVVMLDIKDGDPLREDILEISRAARRAAELTKQLLIFSRKQIMQTKVINLNHVVSGSKRMLGRMIGEDVSLQTLLHEDLKPIKADPVQIEQVIMNLVVNARDAMLNGGTLTVSTKNIDVDPESPIKDFQNSINGPCVLLEVEDTGCGMDQKTILQIFEPFFTTKEHGKGTGLGLSTVFGIVKQSEGVITVDSDLDKGTVFKIYFPALNDAEILDEENHHNGIHGQGFGNVLVVEDDPMLRTLITRLLKKNGYNVIEAQDGLEALTIFEQSKNDLDLLITDVVMPHLNGRQLAEQLSRLQPSLKVLFMSGYADDTLMQHGIFSKGQGYLQKPFSAEVLYQRVKEILLVDK